MRQNSVEADIAASKNVNLLNIRELFYPYFLSFFFLWKQSVIEVHGPHDMEAIDIHIK